MYHIAAKNNSCSCSCSIPYPKMDKGVCKLSEAINRSGKARKEGESVAGVDSKGK